MSRVESGRKTVRTDTTNETNQAERARTPQDVPTLDEISNAPAGDAAATFEDRAGGMSLVGGGVELADDTLPRTAIDEGLSAVGKSCTAELEGASLETRMLAGKAGEVHADLGACYEDAAADLGAASTEASGGRLAAMGGRIVAAEGKLLDAASTIADVLGPAVAAAAPGLAAMQQVRSAGSDLVKVRDAVRNSPEASRELLAATSGIVSGLEATKSVAKGALVAVADGMERAIERLEPGESHQVAVGAETGAGVLFGEREASVKVARGRGGEFVIETETKLAVGVGKKLGSPPPGSEAAHGAHAEVKGKVEGRLKVEWAAADAETARNRAVGLGLSQLVVGGAAPTAALSTLAGKDLRSVEISGADVLSVAAKLGAGELVQVGVSAGAEVSPALRIAFENGEAVGWELTSSVKVDASAVARLAGEDRAFELPAGKLEGRLQTAMSGRLAPGAKVSQLFAGDLSSLAAEGETRREVRLAIDGASPTRGWKMEAAVPVADVERVLGAFTDGDFSGGMSALADTEVDATVTRRARQAVGAGGEVDLKSGSVEVGVAYEHSRETSAQHVQGRLGDEVLRLLVAMASEPAAAKASEQQLAAGRSLVR